MDYNPAGDAREGVSSEAPGFGSVNSELAGELRTVESDDDFLADDHDGRRGRALGQGREFVGGDGILDDVFLFERDASLAEKRLEGLAGLAARPRVDRHLLGGFFGRAQILDHRKL